MKGVNEIKEYLKNCKAWIMNSKQRRCKQVLIVEKCSLFPVCISHILGNLPDGQRSNFSKRNGGNNSSMVESPLGKPFAIVITNSLSLCRSLQLILQRFFVMIVYFQHTWCAVAIIIEGTFVKHRYPRNRVGLGLLLSFCLAYLLW